MKTKLEKNQKEILNKIRKKLISNKTSSEFDIYRYLSNSNKLSFTQLQFYLKKKNLFQYILISIKNFFSFFFYFDYTLYNYFIHKKFDEAIITWGKINDFDNEGNFFDRYGGKSSLQKKRILWIVQYEDTIIPKKISQNIVLFKKSEKKTIHLKFFLFYLLNYEKNSFLLKTFHQVLFIHHYFTTKLVLYLKIQG